MKKSAQSKNSNPTDVDELIKIKDAPVVSINQEGLFTFVNDAFEEAYGWPSEELLKKPVSTIMPPYLRDAHKVGFSRFLMTEEPTLLGQPIQLKVFCKDGQIVDSEHYIIGNKTDGKWRFAAIIKPASR